MMVNNSKLDLVNVDVYTKLGQVLSIRSQDIERKSRAVTLQNFEKKKKKKKKKKKGISPELDRLFVLSLFV